MGTAQNAYSRASQPGSTRARNFAPICRLLQPHGDETASSSVRVESAYASGVSGEVANGSASANANVPAARSRTTPPGASSKAKAARGTRFRKRPGTSRRSPERKTGRRCSSSSRAGAPPAAVAAPCATASRYRSAPPGARVTSSPSSASPGYSTVSRDALCATSASSVVRCAFMCALSGWQKRTKLANGTMCRGFSTARTCRSARSGRPRPSRRSRSRTRTGTPARPRTARRRSRRAGSAAPGRAASRRGPGSR